MNEHWLLVRRLSAVAPLVLAALPTQALAHFTCNTNNSTDSVTITSINTISYQERGAYWGGLVENSTGSATSAAVTGGALSISGIWGSNAAARMITIYDGMSGNTATVEGSLDLCKKVTDRAKQLQGAGTPIQLVWNALCTRVPARTSSNTYVIVPRVKSCTLNGEIPADLLAEAQARYDAARAANPAPASTPSPTASSGRQITPQMKNQSFKRK